MSLRHALLAATILAAPMLLPGQSRAQPVTGLYISAGAGGNYLQQERVLASPGLDLAPKRLSTNIGGVGVAAIGWGFGNGLRVEVEGDVRHNRISKITGFVNGSGPTAAGGDQYAYGGMVNALFDMDIGYNWIYPYFGLGGGIADTHFDDLHAYGIGGTPPIRLSSNGWSTNFAYQGIFGLSFPLAAVPGLSLTTEYRFYGVLDAPSFHARDNVIAGNRGIAGNLDLNSDYNHSLIIGVRYAFNTAPPRHPGRGGGAPRAGAGADLSGVLRLGPVRPDRPCAADRRRGGGPRAPGCRPRASRCRAMPTVPAPRPTTWACRAAGRTSWRRNWSAEACQRRKSPSRRSATPARWSRPPPASGSPKTAG